MIFQLLLKTKMPKRDTILDFKLSDVVFIMLITVKMPTFVGILTLISMIDSCSAELNMKNVL